jgi:TonB family protein
MDCEHRILESNQVWHHAPKVLTGAIVLLAHVAAFSLILSPTSSHQSPRPSASISAFMVEIADQRATDTVPLPDIKFLTPTVNTDTLVSVKFEDLEDDTAVVGSASSPRLSRVQMARPEFFARKVGVKLRQPATVVLAILVLADGRVGEVQVTRSSGRVDVDAAAMDYARALRWIPGTKEHQPQAMRISFPVILSPSA